MSLKIIEYKFKSEKNANNKALYMKKIYGYKPTDFKVKMPKKIYLIAGHGTEELVEFTKREKVPSGRIIVCFPICGRANFMRECCRITHIMNLP